MACLLLLPLLSPLPVVSFFSLSLSLLHARLVLLLLLLREREREEGRSARKKCQLKENVFVFFYI